MANSQVVREFKEIKELNKNELMFELERRGENKVGNKQVLVERLKGLIQEGDKDLDEYLVEVNRGKQSVECRLCIAWEKAANNGDKLIESNGKLVNELEKRLKREEDKNEVLQREIKNLLTIIENINAGAIETKHKNNSMADNMENTVSLVTEENNIEEQYRRYRDKQREMYEKMCIEKRKMECKSKSSVVTTQEMNSKSKQQQDTHNIIVDEKTKRDKKYHRILGRKTEEQKVKTLEEGEVIVMGDSILSGAARICRSNGFDVETYPEIRINELKQKLKEKKRKMEVDPKIGLFHIGSNNIRIRRERHLMLDMKDLLETAKSAFPTTKWIVNGIVYRNDIDGMVINKLNDSIEWLCGEMGAKYINPNEIISGEEAARDGIHLNFNGGQMLGKLIVESVKAVMDIGKQATLSKN